jgi:hypothetical protein
VKKIVVIGTGRMGGAVATALAKRMSRCFQSAGLSQLNEKRKAMIDHIYLPVSDLKRSSEFYKKVLEPLGIDMPYEVGQPPIHGFAINNIPARHSGRRLSSLFEVAPVFYRRLVAGSDSVRAMTMSCAIASPARVMAEEWRSRQRPLCRIHRQEAISMLYPSGSPMFAAR